MILSHEHRFIFVKTRKTAGTSLEIALSQYCGGSDVITRLSAEENEMRRELGYRTTQNTGIPMYKFRPRDVVRAIVQRRPVRFNQHDPAYTVKQRIKADVWRNYFKFTIERNPWDKAISLYYWRTQSVDQPLSLSEYLSTVDKRSLSNFWMYSIGGNVAVDHVIRYENLAGELQALSQRLGLGGDLSMPRAKSTFRADRRHYREVMSPKDRDLVATVCRAEIEYCGYEF